jgi:hypothetical protein
VTGAHQYGGVGTYSITVTINDVGGSSTTATGSTTVADAAVTAGTVSASGGIEGVTPTSLTAVFTDANHGALASDFSGTINWGDGNTTNFTSAAVSGSGGSYTITASHQYAEVGSYAVTVQILDTGGSTANAASTTTVSDASLTAQGQNFSATKGLVHSGVVATFTDADPGAAASDFSATITWGDGQTSSGTIAYDSSNQVFTVSGSNTYATDGSYTPTVLIQHSGGARASAGLTATVSSAPPTVQLMGISATAGSPFSGGVATFTGSGSGSGSSGSVNGDTAVIDWGDNTTPTSGTSTLSGTKSTISGDHTYAQAGTYSITITILNGTNVVATAHGIVSVAAAAGTPTPILTSTSVHEATPAPPIVTLTSIHGAKVVLGKGRKAKKETALQLQFSGALNAAGSISASAYSLLAGAFKKHVLNFKKHVSLASASYNPSTYTVNLFPQGKHKLPKYEQLTINSGLVTDTLGRPINGGRNVVATVSKSGLVISSTGVAASAAPTPAAVDALFGK